MPADPTAEPTEGTGQGAGLGAGSGAGADRGAEPGEGQGPPVRASDLIGRSVRDAAGTPCGRIVDLVVEPDGQGRPRLVAAVAVTGPWGRLLGYERDQVTGPWLLETLARAILRRKRTTIPWAQLTLDR